MLHSLLAWQLLVCCCTSHHIFCSTLQVKQVYNVGLESPGFGRQLTALFRQAVTAGKRVRSETTIASGAVSVSSAAAELAQLKLPSHDWADAKVPRMLASFFIVFCTGTYAVSKLAAYS